MLLRNKVLTIIIILLFFIPFGNPFFTHAADYKVLDLHLSWQNDVTSTMTVSWRTNDLTTSVVEYGLDANYGSEVSSVESTRWHHVELIGLSPNTQYYYRAGNGDVWSKDYTFTTGTSGNYANFISVGDAQADTYNRLQYVNAIDPVNFEYMLYTGDYVETSSALDEYHAWFRHFTSVVTDTPTMGVLGNHEKNHSLYYNFWAFPGKEEYYSFDYGPVHIIGLHTLDTNYITDPAVYEPQVDFLIADLEANQDALWTIVFMHTAPFSSYMRYYLGQYDLVNETFVPIFEQYNVTLVLCGHDAMYERLYCNDINYIISGGAADTMYEVPAGQQIDISEYVEGVSHFLYFEISNDKFHTRSYRLDYSLIDQLIINKDIKPDLSFETVPLTHTQDWEDNLEQEIVITNTGEVNITTNTTLAYTHNDTVEMIEIPPLDIGETYSLNYNWSLTEPGEDTFLFELDYNSECDEVSEENNVLEIKLIGTETVEPTTTPTDDTAFLAGILGSLIMILSLVLPVFIKKKGKFS